MKNSLIVLTLITMVSISDAMESQDTQNRLIQSTIDIAQGHQYLQNPNVLHPNQYAKYAVALAEIKKENRRFRASTMERSAEESVTITPATEGKRGLIIMNAETAVYEIDSKGNRKEIKLEVGPGITVRYK